MENNGVTQQLENNTAPQEPQINWKKWIAAIVVIVIIIVALLAIFFLYTRQAVAPKSTTTSKNIPQNASISFYPSTVLLSNNNPTQTVEVMLSAPQNTTAAELVMLYDPQAISQVSMLAPSSSFFGDQSQYSLIKNSIYSQQGTIDYAIGLAPKSTFVVKGGKNVVAYLTFSRNPSYTKTSTVIAFLKSSIVTQKGKTTSILEKADPLEISIMH